MTQNKTNLIILLITSCFVRLTLKIDQTKSNLSFNFPNNENGIYLIRENIVSYNGYYSRKQILNKDSPYYFENSLSNFDLLGSLKKLFQHKNTTKLKDNSQTTPMPDLATTPRPFFWPNMQTKDEIRRAQSEMMQKYLKTDIDPCDDFYEFSCGNWKKYYTIPPDRSSYDTFEMVRENLDFALRGLLEHGQDNDTVNLLTIEKYATTKYLCKKVVNDTSDATVKAKHLFKSCMQENILTKRGASPLKRILRELRGWPIIEASWTEDNFDMIWLLAELRLLNNDVLIAQWVGPDMKNSNEYIIHIDQSNLGLPEREYYLDDDYIKYVKAYRVFILTIVGILGAPEDTVQEDVDAIIEFETLVADIMASSEERRNISEFYLRTDIGTFSLYFPQIDWARYFNKVLGRDVKTEIPIACYCAKYLHRLVYLLTVTPKRILQNYLLWRFVRHRINELDYRFAKAKQHFYSILIGREKEPPRWQFCVTQVNANMGMALGALFVKKYFSCQSRRDTIEMTERLEEAFRDTLMENTWLDNHTKEYARMKINQIDLKIGYPDFILNQKELAERYSDVEIHQNYFFENILNILRHLTRVEQNRIETPVNRTLWSTPPAVVNAYYSRNKNQIMFPAGMLQPPFYHRFFPKALNFGGIGVVIGHEITHGFDDKGRLFDHEGNLHLWWRGSSIEKFYEKCQCVIDQYSQFVLPEINIALDGFLTQGENIADNGGLKQSYRAYETWLKSNPNCDESLPGLNYTGRQLFFLNFAQVWCGQQRAEAAKNRLKTSVHAPGIFRVLGVVSNSEEFAEAFHCKKNAPMNPEYKCTIW